MTFAIGDLTQGPGKTSVIEASDRIKLGRRAPLTPCSLILDPRVTRAALIIMGRLKDRKIRGFFVPDIFLFC